MALIASGVDPGDIAELCAGLLSDDKVEAFEALSAFVAALRDRDTPGDGAADGAGGIARLLQAAVIEARPCRQPGDPNPLAVREASV